MYMWTIIKIIIKGIATEPPSSELLTSALLRLPEAKKHAVSDRPQFLLIADKEIHVVASMW